MKITKPKNTDGQTIITSNYDSRLLLKEEQTKATPLWLSISEAAKLGGVQNKTIRRAIKSNVVKYKIIKNRYLIETKTLIVYLHANTKLKNKLNNLGIGQYVAKWRNI